MSERTYIKSGCNPVTPTFYARLHQYTVPIWGGREGMGIYKGTVIGRVDKKVFW
jgi:hypothetical protein